MLHKHLLDFTRKYNKEFAIKGYSKLKKADLQTKIESVLNKQRKEIKEEYKKLKETKAEPAKKTPVKKPVVKKEPVKKPVVKKTPVKKEPVKKSVVKKSVVKKTPVKKEPVKKSAPKKEYKFTKNDIMWLKDWADSRKRNYNKLTILDKKEILFDLKKGVIDRQTKGDFKKYKIKFKD